MKRVLSVFMLLLLTMPVMAQQPIQSQIDRQYVNAAHQQVMYRFVPELQSFDASLIEQRKKFEESILEQPKRTVTTNSDTSWAYSENIGYYDSEYTPNTFSHFFSLGDSVHSTSHSNQYLWSNDSTDWLPNRIQTSFINHNYYDSVTTYYYQYNQTEPYTGTRIRYMREPSDEADSEQFWDLYEPGNGWIPNQRDLFYKDDNGWDTLSVSYQFNRDSLDYYLSSKRRNLYQENYTFSEDIYYFFGRLDQLSRYEDTPDFILSENKSYDYTETLAYWRWEYLKKKSNGGYDYQLVKEYDTESMRLVNKDSTYYHYRDNNTMVESEGFVWMDSLYVLNALYRNFQREVEPQRYLVDSVIVYSIDTVEETNERVEGRPMIKTVMEYDAQYNQTLVANFSIIDDSLQMQSKTEREFELIGNYYTQTKQRTYNYHPQTGQLYYSGISENIYKDGEYAGNKYFIFNPAGDTTYGYVSQTEYMADGSRADVRFDWNNQTKKLELRSYRISNRQITGDGGQKFNQYLSASLLPDGSESLNRSMNGYSSYPGIFNDGPLSISLGDTLSFYVSARNPDFTIPEIEVSNMPSTATFNAETRKFYWVVDEENPSPMTYKAIRGDKYVTTEVEFITGSFSVSNEEKDQPLTFLLAQNYPNPFNPSTNIGFTLPESGFVELRVYSILGQEVATLINERMSGGSHTVAFDASRLSSGMYIYRLQAGNHVQTRKMVLIK